MLARVMTSTALLATLMSLSPDTQAQVSVSAPWVRATVAHQKATGAFMQLQSPTATRLVAVSTPLTPIAEVHEMVMHGDVMRMREVKALELPAGQTVELKPGGYHLMLMNLSAQVKEGQIVPITLTFETTHGQRETVQVQAPVRALNAGSSPTRHSQGSAHGTGHEGHGSVPAAGHKH